MIEADSSTCTTNFWNSPSPGRSAQWDRRPGSASRRVGGGTQGQRVRLHLRRPDCDLLHDDLFSMSWHNLLPICGCLSLHLKLIVPNWRISPEILKL